MRPAPLPLGHPPLLSTSQPLRITELRLAWPVSPIWPSWWRHEGPNQTELFKRHGELPWAPASTLDPPEFILDPAPRGILLEPEVNHVTALCNTFRWHHTSLGANPKFSLWPTQPCVPRPVPPLSSHLLPHCSLHTPLQPSRPTPVSCSSSSTPESPA